jgi:CubicO group peptidase (beta-lactamase class C family)
MNRINYFDHQFNIFYSQIQHNQTIILSMKSAVFSSLAVMAQATTYTPLLGPAFPHASNLSFNDAFQNMTANLTITLEAIVLAGNSSSASSESILNSQDTSFALQIFASDAASDGNNTLFQYFYTSPATANASSGVRHVDESTVFRIGSASKLWTVYTLLASAGEASLHDPVTKWVPELQAAAARADDAVDFVRWEDVTIQELASHLAGVGRDCKSSFSNALC